jgi:hypothetical protein
MLTNRDETLEKNLMSQYLEITGSRWRSGGFDEASQKIRRRLNRERQTGVGISFGDAKKSICTR